MIKNNKILFGILLALGMILLFQNLYYHYLETSVDATDDTRISFLIPKGSSATQVAENLKKQDLIKSKTVFNLYARRKGVAQNLIAGRFYLNKKMNIPQILETITDASKAESAITIQEGLTVKDIDEKLVEMELISKGEFIDAVKKFDSYEDYTFLDKDILKKLEIPLEGYIFPDTYFLDGADFEPGQLIKKGLDNFDSKVEGIIPNIHEIVTMASILEQEVRTEEDLPIVSGILWKRYHSNWHLGADATLLYITDDRKITAKDLEIDSPYNTRKVVGIPPGPIGNPGLRSIKAALNPESSPYWYYLTTLDTGVVIYAKDNDEQNVNRAEYLY